MSAAVAVLLSFRYHHSGVGIHQPFGLTNFLTNFSLHKQNRSSLEDLFFFFLFLISNLSILKMGRCHSYKRWSVFSGCLLALYLRSLFVVSFYRNLLVLFGVFFFCFFFFCGGFFCNHGYFLSEYVEDVNKLWVCKLVQKCYIGFVVLFRFVTLLDISCFFFCCFFVVFFFVVVVF